MQIRHPQVLLAYAGLFVAALIVRLVFWAEISGTPLDQWHTWTETDSATYLEQARRMAAGDWLGRDPYHPYHLWQKASGSKEDWLTWYGPAAFHQAPLYSVALALTQQATSRFIDVIKVTQLMLGAGTCVLVAMLARRLGGTTIGIVAGALCACYGPLYYLETQVLREGPAVFGATLMLLFTVICITQPPKASRRRRFMARVAVGLLAGLMVCFHESALPLAVSGLIVLAAHGASRSGRQAVAAVGTFAAGYLVGFSPMLARNLAVGAAPFSTSSRLAVNLAYCNMSSVENGGIIFLPPGPQLKQIMDSAHGSIFGVVREVWRSYEGQRARFFGNLLMRFGAVWMTVEFPDNTSYTFYRSQAPILAISPSFAWIAAPAVAAILMLLGIAAWPSRNQPTPTRFGRHGKEKNTARVLDDPLREIWNAGGAAAHLAVLGFMPPLVGAMTLVHPQARYRLFLVPMIICYAAIGIVVVWRWARARRFEPLAGFVALALVLFLTQRAMSTRWLEVDNRYTDWAFTGASYMDEKNYAAVVPYYHRALVLAPNQTAIRSNLVDALIKLGRYDQAREELVRILQEWPSAERERRLLEYVEQQLQSGTGRSTPQ